MTIPKFDPSELEVVSVDPESMFMPAINTYKYPVSLKEAYRGMLNKQAVWQIIGNESVTFMPRIIPDNVARGMVFESAPFDAVSEGGGKDMFGLDWVYVPVAEGSMIEPGNPYLDDANDWKEKIIWPDIDSWDWEGSAELNNGTFLKDNVFNVCMFLTGWYERLIAFMDFEGAILAMVDEDQQDAVKEFFDKLTDFYIAIFDKLIDTYPMLDAFEIHDDWGSQQDTFFSPETAEDMLVPYMKRLVDHLHARGKYCLLHSCGQNLKQVPNYIKAGWDVWNPQPVNDIDKIYELYGDQIILGTMPAEVTEGTPESEQRAAARDYADKYCHSDKPTYVNMYGRASLHSFFREELYIQSRKKYGGE